MASGLPPDDLLSLYQTARQVTWRYRLDEIEVSALRTAMRSTEKAAKDILSQPTEKLQKWEQLRRQDLIREIDSVTLGIREQVSGEISSLAGQAGAESAKYHSQTMSLGDKVAGFNNVALSPEQFRSFFQTTPLGGHTLNGWVNRAFDATVRQGILEDLGDGVLQGKGYRGLVDNIMGHMEGFTRKEAVTLARTFVQTANCEAQKAVMAANADIVKGWRWSSVLENSNLQTGTGTCLRCAVNDGNEYKLGEGPPIPLHVRCRCVPISVLVSYRDLGIDVDELEDVARPWTERPDIPIGEGSRNITSWGTHKGEYASWFNSRGEQFQKNVVGPKRLALIQSGKVKFKDLVDPQTGRLYRLDELGKPPAPAFTSGFLNLKDKKSTLAALAGIRGDARGNYTYRAIEKASKKTPTIIVKDRSGKIISAANLKIEREAIDIDVLGSIGPGGGTEAIKQVSKYSQELGKSGAVQLTPLGDSATISFYIKTGFDGHPAQPGRFLLTPDMAKEMGFLK